MGIKVCGVTLKQIRKNKGFKSQQSLADLTGVPRTTIARIESSYITSLGEENANKISDALEISVNELSKILYRPFLVEGKMAEDDYNSFVEIVKEDKYLSKLAHNILANKNNDKIMIEDIDRSSAIIALVSQFITENVVTLNFLEVLFEKLETLGLNDLNNETLVIDMLDLIIKAKT